MYTLGFAIILALTAVVLSLAAGVASMSSGGRFDMKHSTQLMTIRIILQVVALLFVVFAVYMGEQALH